MENKKEDRATEEWLNSQKANTRGSYRYSWGLFSEFVGLNGDQILADRAQDKTHAWEAKTLAFKTWMQKEKGRSENTAKGGTTAVRSFFAFHRTTLEFRRPEKSRLKEASRVAEDYRFSRDDLKKMADFANLKEKYIIIAGKSFGLRASDFMAITRGSLEAYINREVPICIGPLNTEKEGVKAFPFVDSDAQPIIKLMLEDLTRRGRTKPSDRILNFREGRELTRTLQRVTKKAGINVGDRCVRFHGLRKFLIDRLSSFMSESKWKQIVGKTISEGAYISPDSLREDYARAMAETTFTKAPENVELQVKKQIALQMLKNLGISATEVKALFQRRTKTLAEEVDEIERILAEKSHNDCKDGGHCEGEFKQIAESELLENLKAGWQIVKELSNRDVIVKRVR